MEKNSRALIAEFIGTFTLVFIGAMAVAAGIGVTGAGFAHGLVVLAMAYAIGPISGAHLNPAVTLGIALTGKMSWADALPYWGVQLFAGIVASAVIWLFASSSVMTYGETTLNINVSWWQGIGIEAILTFFLVFVVLMTAVLGKENHHAPLAIGLTLAFCIMAGAGLTGASLNPARTLGPSLFGGRLGFETLVYFIGPALGAFLAATAAGALTAVSKGRSR